MPLELVAEVFFRFLLEAIVYALGYGTGWLLVPALSLGYYTVEPLSPPRRGARRIRSRGIGRPREVSAQATTAVGIVFWAVVVAAGLAFWWLARPA